MPCMPFLAEKLIRPKIVATFKADQVEPMYTHFSKKVTHILSRKSKAFIFIFTEIFMERSKMFCVCMVVLSTTYHVIFVASREHNRVGTFMFPPMDTSHVGTMYP